MTTQAQFIGPIELSASGFTPVDRLAGVVGSRLNLDFGGKVFPTRSNS